MVCFIAHPLNRFRPVEVPNPEFDTDPELS